MDETGRDRTPLDLPSYLNSKCLKHPQYLEEDIFIAIGGVVAQCEGAYACIAMLADSVIRMESDLLVWLHARLPMAARVWIISSSESVVADACRFTG